MRNLEGKRERRIEICSKRKLKFLRSFSKEFFSIFNPLRIGLSGFSSRAQQLCFGESTIDDKNIHTYIVEKKL